MLDLSAFNGQLYTDAAREDSTKYISLVVEPLKVLGLPSPGKILVDKIILKIINHKKC